MKRLVFLISTLLIVISIFNSCKPDPAEELGSIYGVVTDKATGEPVKNANVQLRPSGETTLTGNDGRYEFLDLKNGDYSIVVSKTEYTDLVDDYVITIEGSKAIRRDVQIEKVPGKLKILDSNGNEIGVLDFGSMQDDNVRLFNIFNNSTLTLEYELYKTASWVTKLSSESGTMSPGTTKTIVVTIDRTKLSVGDNATTLSIITNNGGKQLTLKAKRIGDDDDNNNDDNNDDDNNDDNTQIELPTVTTKSVSNITETSAVCGGNVTSDGGSTVTAKGVCWSTSQNPTIDDSKTNDGSGSGSYTSNITGLTGNTTYYVRAYATNSKGTSYGEQRSFKTDEVTYKPTVTTKSVSNITETSAVCGGNVTSDGGSTVTAKGVCWSTSQNPTIDDSKTNDGSGSGSYTSNITGLTGNTTYYVRAYATNSEGTSYGEQRSFTTNYSETNHNGHEYVDLGLSVKWATCNVGANAPEDYGNYYAWGETTTKDTYNSSTSATYGLSYSSLQSQGYIDSEGNLTAQHDAATANWGGDWRMPTEAEQEELLNNCTWTWTTLNGVRGYKVSSKVNSNYIFLPAAGCRSGSSLNYAGSYGSYWSSAPVESHSSIAKSLDFDSSNHRMRNNLRYDGQSVRPVLE